MKICIYGLGAVGGLMAARLAGSGANVSAVARGATLDAVRRDGLTLIDTADGQARRQRFTLAVSERPERLGVQDVVVVAVKATGLPDVARAIAPLLGPETTVLSAMNGVPWWFFHGLAPEHASMQLQCIDPDGSISAAMAPGIAEPSGAMRRLCPRTLANHASLSIFFGQNFRAESRA